MSIITENTVSSLAKMPWTRASNPFGQLLARAHLDSEDVALAADVTLEEVQRVLRTETATIPQQLLVFAQELGENADELKARYELFRVGRTLEIIAEGRDNNMRFKELRRTLVAMEEQQRDD